MGSWLNRSYLLLFAVLASLVLACGGERKVFEDLIRAIESHLAVGD